jgi:WhiB family redox-sensing transcriptional regulator
VPQSERWKVEYPIWDSTPACIGTDTNDWFAQEDKPTAYANEPLLRRICSGCPVRQQCFNYALHHVVDGYWAGTTPRVRQQMRKRLGIEAEVIYKAGMDTYGPK